MGIQTSLDAVRAATRLVDSMRLADDLAFEANRDPGARTIRILTQALDDDDQIVAIAATHALAQVFDEQADVALSGLLSSDRLFLREHAAWAIGSRIPRYDTIGRLVSMVADGGFGGMLAQRTLEQWAFPTPEHVAIGVEGALIGIREPATRYRLVETLGLVRSRIALRPLLEIAADANEDETVRVAAVSALGQRTGDAQVEAFLAPLAAGDGYLADVARLALVDLAGGRAVRDEPHDDITVAQLFLHADIDAQLTQAGSGDNGGIATLLVRLGDALIAGGRPDAGTHVHRVITMSRGSAQGALASVDEIRATSEGHLYGRIPLLSEPVNSASAWPLRVAARRGVRRMLRAAGGVDLLHLRMADVGSLAAADVARELDVPVVFTVAPDPHAVIRSLDLAGQLTRWNFGDVDETEHFWFRTRLVQRLASNAAHTVLFPRPELERDMRELVGIEMTSHPERHTVVPEGIDLGVVDRGVAEAAAHASGQPATPPLDELRDLLEQLPEQRRALPLVVSVGRFHRVKGMASIVEAWARGGLRDQANLLLIGGDLEHPSVDEREQLAIMNSLVPAQQRAASGLLLPGHRPNDTVARWVAAARFGVPGLAAPRGVYVCGSLKEEFGIALLEAMAAGLLVVAPDGGGPATYVDRGVTGFLTQTWHVERLAASMGEALRAAAAESGVDRAAASRRTVEKSFTIEAMATALAEVYAGVHAESDTQFSPAAVR
ncbi:glycosyltransferase [Herbiconiux daphne]|uniref:D-inositol 3-phosphate glycosyltransferase n=1 Tax=Herbiconiux daphne TaxID=2970914 RepID=A0ABT2H7V7_9MICO|nr:glycosyltransferase [Herbiconiux daphne]MCS5736008.1 glycosyltransferase [Herbiconiux daphne]